MAFRRVLVILLLGLAPAGCTRSGEPSPSLIDVSALEPHEPETGERLEISGAGFPTGRIARLFFRGVLRRYGEAPITGIDIEAEGVATTPQQIRAEFTPELEERFCGASEHATRAVFEGELEVSFATATAGAPPVVGVLRGVSLDVRPPVPRGSPVAASLNVVERAAPGRPPPLGAVLVVSAAAAAVLVLFAPTPTMFGWLLRHLSTGFAARLREMQRRATAQGRSAVASAGARPRAGSSRSGAGLRSAYLLGGAASLPLVALALAHHGSGADLNIAILLAAWICSLAMTGVLTASGMPGRASALVGASRAFGRVLSCALPTVVAAACAVVMAGSLQLSDIVRAQGGWPWEWYALHNPATCLLAFSYFAVTLANADASCAPMGSGGARAARLSASSGTRRWVHAATVYVASGLGAALWFGGWQLPALSPVVQQAHLMLRLSGGLLYLLKTWVVVAAATSVLDAIGINGADSVAPSCWKHLIPLSLAAALFNTVWVAWSPSRPVQLVVSGALSLLLALVAVCLMRHVHTVMRKRDAQIHVNPSL